MAKFSGTVGQLLVDSALPEPMRGRYPVLDVSGMRRLLQEVAEKYPDDYPAVSQRLLEIGSEAAYTGGGVSYGLKHLRPALAARALRLKLAAVLRRIREDPDLDDDEKADRVVAVVGREQDGLERSILAESIAEDNPLGNLVRSGSRGSPANLRSLRGGDLLYTDHRERVIPVPILRSYSEGLSPVEYFAGTFGARRGVLASKLSVREGGYFGKLLGQVSHRVRVSAMDDDSEPRWPRGLPVATDDPDNEGALLELPAGGYPRNTVLTAKVLGDLGNRGIDKILIRSVAARGSPEGGVYARDVGVREYGRLPQLGEFVGLSAAQSLAEPAAQGALSSKHSGGVFGQERAVSGLAALQQLVQVPKQFAGGATHAQEDGRVDRIEPAPAGGFHVSIVGKPHFVPAGYPLRVKVGSVVDAGDVLSDGVPNPAEIVAHKGIGEGRRYWVDAMRAAYREAGLPAHRRNLEIVAQGLINHVRLDDEVGGGLPDDVVPYGLIEKQYEPRGDARALPPAAAIGKFLESPILHHTIGTKVRRSMLSDLERFGIGSLLVHDEAPPFAPEMVRASSILSHDPDWMTQLLGANLQKSLLRSAQRGRTSYARGTSFVPSLIKAVDFGKPIAVGTETI